MKKHLLITISNYNFSAQFRLHRVLCWFLMMALCSLLGTLIWDQYQLREAKALEAQTSTSLVQSRQTIEQLHQVQHSLFSTLDQNQDQLRLMGTRLAELETLAGSEGELEFDIEQRIRKARVGIFEKQALLSKIPNGIPMEYWRVSSKFGMRIHPITKRRHSHIGMDLRANLGTPIYATADGFVEKARSNYDKGYGNMITLRHQMGFSTRFAHLNKVLVKYGQYVRKGELIGLCGNSGDSTASHLHYEVLFLGKALDPKPFMKLNLANYEQITQAVRTIPWDSFHQEIRLLSQHPVQPSLPQAHASRVPLNSAATFMSMAK